VNRLEENTAKNPVHRLICHMHIPVVDDIGLNAVLMLYSDKCSSDLNATSVTSFNAAMVVIRSV